MRIKNRGFICALEGCTRNARKRMYCETHYARLRAHGDATKTLRAANGSLKKWIDENKNYSGDDCLIWPFTRSTDGRGQVMISGKNRKAPRVMCEEVNGPPPTPEHQAAHSCGMGHIGCISPKHLSWKTRKENEADKIIHGTRLRGEDAWNSKITAEQAKEIYIRSQKETCNSLSIEFGLHAGTISQIKRGKRWRHVTIDSDDNMNTTVNTL